MNPNYFLILLFIGVVQPFYLYDRFNNKAVVNYADTFIYYASDSFHSIEYSNKLYNNSFLLKLRNNSKSMPELKFERYNV